MPIELKNGIVYVPRQELEDVILELNARSYGGEGESVYKPTNRGTLLFSEPAKSHNGYIIEDEFWGDFKFSGYSLVRTVINQSGTNKQLIIWSMIYTGETLSDNHHTIFRFLREALKVTPRELPFRGPAGRFISDYYPSWWSHMKLVRPSSIESGEGSRRAYHQGVECYRELWSGGIPLENRDSIILV